MTNPIRKLFDEITDLIKGVQQEERIKEKKAGVRRDVYKVINTIRQRALEKKSGSSFYELIWRTYIDYRRAGYDETNAIKYAMIAIRPQFKIWAERRKVASKIEMPNFDTNLGEFFDTIEREKFAEDFDAFWKLAKRDKKEKETYDKLRDFQRLHKRDLRRVELAREEREFKIPVELLEEAKKRDQEKRKKKRARKEQSFFGFPEFMEKAEKEYEEAETKRAAKRSWSDTLWKPLTSTKIWSGTRVKYLTYNIMFFALGAIASRFLPPFFGLPAANWFMWAFILAIPYTTLPTEDDLRRGYLDNRKKQQSDQITNFDKEINHINEKMFRLNPEHPQYESQMRAFEAQTKAVETKLSQLSLTKIESFRELASSAVFWSLVPKSFLKITIYSCIILQFFLFNRMLSLIAAFFLYFYLPSRYRSDQPNRMFEAWFRMIMGVFIAYIFWMTFAQTPVGWSLGLLALAFFFTFPVATRAGDDVNEMHVVIDMGSNLHSSGTDKSIFFILMFLSLWFSGIFWGQITGANAVIFGAFWVISLISGLSTGPEGRPALGSTMIIIALFVFSSSFTGVMGQAVFGYWWPQVYGTMEVVGDVVGPAWEQLTAGVGETWTLMTNPAAYYESMMRRQQASTTKLETGGSPLSIEMARFEMFTSLMGILDPKLDSIVGTIELENMGEFNAENIIAEVWAEWQDVGSMTMETVGVGQISKIECSEPSDNSTGPNREPNQIAVCDWTKETVADEIRFLSFVFEKDAWTLPDGDNLNKENPPDPETGIVTYNHSAEMFKINLNFTYDYDVNVSIPVEVIDNQLYQDLLKAREITLQELMSKYTGGPAKATLWSQRQPIRDGESTLFVASLYNDGSGDLIEIKSFKVLIPVELSNNVNGVAHTFTSCNPSDRSDEDTIVVRASSITGYWEIDCISNELLEPTQFRRVSFFLEPVNLPEKIRKTSNIVGLAEYIYEKTESKMLTIANAPMG